MLFYRDSLCGHSERERRFAVNCRDNKVALCDDILPTAEILFKYAHRGSTFAEMLRCGRGVCGTTRVDVKRATCPSAQGSAWTVVVIFGKLTLFIAIAINMNSRAKIRIFFNNIAG